MNLNEMIEEYLKIRNLTSYKIDEVFKYNETVKVRLTKEQKGRSGTIRTDAFELNIDIKQMEIETLAVNLNKELEVKTEEKPKKKLKL